MEIQKQIENINGQAINSADSKMVNVYKKQKQAMQEIIAFIALLYFHYEINGSLKINRAQKAAIFQQFNTKLIRIYNDLGNAEKDTLTDILKSNYKFLYDETFDIYNIYHVSKPVLIEQDIMAAVLIPIDGELYTERIWKNKEKTFNLLKKATDSILNDDVPNDIAKQNIENIFNLTAFDTERLMTSEDTRVRAQASDDIAKVLGIKKHIWSAAFENTCKHCRELHGKEFNIDDKSAPTIPLHAHCRCMWINSLTNGKNSLTHEENDKISQKNIQNSYTVNRKLVNSKEYHDKFESLPLSKPAKENIYAECKKILEHRDGNPYEDLVVLDAKTGKVIAANRTASDKLKTGLTKESYEKVLNHKGDIVLMHNHPGGGRLSIADILAAYKQNNVTLSIAVGHDGIIHYINNINRKIDIELQYNLEYNKLKQIGIPAGLAKLKATDKIYESGYFDYYTK